MNNLLHYFNNIILMSKYLIDQLNTMRIVCVIQFNVLPYIIFNAHV